MKNVMAAMALTTMMMACSNNNGKSGVQNDGIQAVDSNGGLADTTFTQDQSATDTSKDENRVDISARDTFR